MGEEEEERCRTWYHLIAHPYLSIMYILVDITMDLLVLIITSTASLTWTNSTYSSSIYSYPKREIRHSFRSGRISKSANLASSASLFLTCETPVPTRWYR